jgi:carboxymethylenebutenolidase
MIKIPAENKASFDAYVSAQGDGPKPGLIICSEAFGVNAHIRSVADRFANIGYLVVVPDLLWRIEPNLEIAYNEAGLKRASEIADIFDKDAGAADVERALGQVRQRTDCNGKVGVLGFCIGGAVAYLAAVRSPLDACISYYGKGVENYLGEAQALTCPTVLHYAGADRFILPSTVADVRRGLTAKRNVEIYDYPGVDHGFNSEDRKAYNRAVAELAMQRTLRVLSLLQA